MYIHTYMGLSTSVKDYGKPTYPVASVAKTVSKTCSDKKISCAVSKLTRRIFAAKSESYAASGQPHGSELAVDAHHRRRRINKAEEEHFRPG